MSLTITFPVIKLKVHGTNRGIDAQPESVARWLPDFMAKFIEKEFPDDRLGNERMIAALLRYTGMVKVTSGPFLDRCFGTGLPDPTEGQWRIDDKWDFGAMYIYAIQKDGSIKVYETEEDWVEARDPKAKTLLEVWK